MTMLARLIFCFAILLIASPALPQDWDPGFGPGDDRFTSWSGACTGNDASSI